MWKPCRPVVKAQTLTLGGLRFGLHHFLPGKEIWASDSLSLNFLISTMVKDKPHLAVLMKTN